MNAPKPEPETLVRVDNGSGEMAVMGALWFSSAFDVAVGSSISEVLSRFSEDLRALVSCAQTEDMLAHITPAQFLEQVEKLRLRMSVAAEWAERVEKLAELEGAAARADGGAP